MLYTFFTTQLNNPTPGDWTEQVKLDCVDFDIPFDFENIVSKSKESFKRIVKIKAEEYELERLRVKQGKHTKTANVRYTDMKMQEFFKTPGITTEQALNLFKWRVRMATFGENFRGGQPFVMCPLCQNHLDNQSMALGCEEIKKKMVINISIEDIHKESIPLEVVQELSNIMKVRNELIEDRK